MKFVFIRKKKGKYESKNKNKRNLSRKRNLERIEAMTKTLNEMKTHVHGGREGDAVGGQGDKKGKHKKQNQKKMMIDP